MTRLFNIIDKVPLPLSLLCVTQLVVDDNEWHLGKSSLSRRSSSRALTTISLPIIHEGQVINRRLIRAWRLETSRLLFALTHFPRFQRHIIYTVLIQHFLQREFYLLV